MPVMRGAPEVPAAERLGWLVADYELWRRQVIRVVARLDRRAEAADIADEAVARLWREAAHRSAVRDARPLTSSYLMFTARNVLIDWQRRQRFVGPNIDGAWLAEAGLRDEAAAEALLEGLSDRQRETVVRRAAGYRMREMPWPGPDSRKQDLADVRQVLCNSP